MSDTATRSLNHITKSGDYTVIKDFPIFDEHDEFDHDGKPIRKFDKAALQKIVDVCNKRCKGGSLSPVGPGHTISGAPEHLQPPIYGYAKDFKVGKFGPEDTTGILVDLYVKNTVTTPDGRQADGVTEIKSYPRPSIELWTRDGVIDWIAMLRRTPQRDLGLLDFDKENHQQVTIPSTGNLYASAKRDYSYAAAVRGGKLCYAMEYAMPMDQVPAMSSGTPGGPPPGGGDDDQDYQQFCKNADRYMTEKYGDALKKYEKPPTGDAQDLASADPTIPPSTGPDDLQKMARQFASADKAVQVAQFQRLLTRLNTIENTSKQQQLQFSRDDAGQRVAGLITEGYVMDPAEETAEFERRPLGTDRDQYAAKIRQRYQRDLFNAAPPVRGPMLNTMNPNGGPKRYSKADIDRAVEKSGGDPNLYEKILAEMAAAK